MFHNIKTSLLLAKLGDWLLKTFLGGCHLLSGSLERLQHGVHAGKGAHDDDDGGCGDQGCDNGICNVGQGVSPGEEGCRAESVHQELSVVPSTGYFATHQKSLCLIKMVRKIQVYF